MHTERSVLIHADPSAIFSIASDIERWPERLPHYRYVRVRLREGHRLVADMSASRDGIPVRWTAEQVLFPDALRMTFRHIRGVTKGMEVEWRLEPTARGVKVSIHHDLRLAWPVVGGIVADRIIGPMFIDNIAGKTLRQVKRLAEALDTLPSVVADAPDKGS
jgi:ribosome-associated toxin RatA of RatAB toxin-antitoxin module